MEYKIEDLTKEDAAYIGKKIKEIVPHEVDADEEEFVLKVENENGEIVGGRIAQAYDRCSFETKKMFVSKFIKSVRVFRDYRLEIDFNVSYEEFQNLTVQTAV